MSEDNALTTTADLSFTDYRAALADPVTPPTPVVEAPKKEAPVENNEPESGTGTDEEPKQPEEVEEELAPGVKKRIAKEVERTTRAQRAIDEAVSARKAKEDEAEKLKGKPGSEPEKQTTAPKEPTKPVRPDMATFTGTVAEWNAANDKYDEDYKSYLQGETRKAVAIELKAEQAKAQEKQEWDDAAKKHGAEFPALMKSLTTSTSPELQLMISGLDDWSGVAVHLAKPANQAERDAIEGKFKTNPMEAYYDLRQLETRLKPAAKPVVEKPLPEPLTAVAGAAGATGAVDLDKADRPYLALKRAVEKTNKK